MTETLRQAMQRLFLAWGALCFRWRNALFPTVFVVLVVFFHPRGGPQDGLLDAAGVLCGLAGQALRAAVVGLAYIRRGGKNKQAHADTLVTEGLFGVMRNPLYVANALGIAGILLIYNNPWVYGLGGGFFVLAYAAMVANEERYLLDRFGDVYRAYCRDVPRFLPKLSALRHIGDGLSFSWKRVLAKEYASFFSGLSVTLAVLAYEVPWTAPPASRTAIWVALGCAWLVLALLTVWVGRLKHRGALREKLT